MITSTPKVSTLLVSAAVGLSLAACTVPGGTTTSTTTAPPTVVIIAPMTPTTATPAPAIAEPTLSQPQSSSSGPQIIRVDPGSQRTLTKADAFAAQNWDEGSYQAVGQAQTGQAIAYAVACDYGTNPLEFRFSQNQGTLKFVVAQAMNSRSSAEKQEWALIVDGRQVQTKSISFKDSVEITTPLSGVAVVQLKVSEPRPCSGSSIGLITSAVITG